MYSTYTEFKKELLKCLEDWFWAMENGTANSRLPDQNYPRKWTEQDQDRTIRNIEKEFVDEVEKNNTYWMEKGVTHGPGFDRIEGLAKEAFLQDLHRIVEKYKYLNLDHYDDVHTRGYVHRSYRVSSSG